MPLALLREGATSTEDRAERRAQKDVSTMSTHVATAPTGRICAEKLTPMAFTGRAIGWVVEFLATATSRGTVIRILTGQPSNDGARIAALCERVEHMRLVGPDWNGYGSEAPNQFAIENAKEILLSATSFVVPNRVAPSAQGGVGICFYRGNKYADIECLNTGEILATTSDGTGRPEVWEVKPSESKGALQRIGQYIAS